MILSRSSRVLRSAARGFHASAKTSIKVAVVGAAGGIGQPLSMLFKLDRGVSHLNLMDIVHTPGVAADLSHIPTPAKVKAFKGVDQMEDALAGMDFIVVPAGVPRKPGMTRDDLFNINASIVKGVAEAASKSAPDAAYLIISNPINSTVPIFAEVLKKNGTYNPKKLFGVTTLDCIRASTFVAESQNWDPTTTRVNVVGGHAGTTIIPLLSQVRGAKYAKDDIPRLTHRIQFGGDEVVKAKDGAGSATLSMAYAGYLFGSHVVNALNGQLGIVECAFVENNLTEAPFFACPVTLGKDGIEHIHELGPLSKFEREAIKKAVPDLIKQAQKGIDFVRSSEAPKAEAK